MDASHASLRDDYEVSLPEIDRMVADRARPARRARRAHHRRRLRRLDRGARRRPVRPRGGRRRRRGGARRARAAPADPRPRAGVSAPARVREYNPRTHDHPRFRGPGRVLRPDLRHRLLLRPPQPLLDGVLPRRPQRRLVRHRHVAVCHQHLERALHRPCRLGRDHRPGRRPLRVARGVHGADARLGVHAVLPAQRRVHDARVPRAPLRPGLPLVPHDRVGAGLHLHEDLRVALRRGAAARDAARLGLLHVGGRDGGRHRRVHGGRRPGRGHLHRAGAGDHPARRRDRAHGARARTKSAAGARCAPRCRPTSSR